MNSGTAMLAVERRQEATAAAGRKAIPFDYTAHFPREDERERRGEPPRLEKDRKLTALVQVSIEAPYVATGVGYGFVLPASTLEFGAPPGIPRGTDLVEASLDALNRKLLAAPRSGLTLDAVLAHGIRINPKYLAQLVPRAGTRRGFAWKSLQAQPADLFIAQAPAPEQLQFLYAIHDEGTGRAFQNEMVLSTAGLGGPDGRRPFRQFATPVQFAPLSTIRIEIVPLQTLVGELHFSLHGYKVLGSPGSPTDVARGARRLRRGARR